MRAMVAQLIALQQEKVAASFSIEAYAGKHRRQLEVLQAMRVEARILLMMARQAGKSWIICGGLIDRSMARPETTSLFFGLNGVAVRKNFWEPVWKRILTRFQIDCVHNEQHMSTRFPNGSQVLLTGTDDLRHVQNVLGMRLAGSMIAIDESQSQPPGVLTAMLVDILPPTLTPTSTLVLSGTIPKAPGGVWWKEAQKTSWKQWSWGRVRLIGDDTMPLESRIVAENPHTPEAPAVLVKHMADNKLTLADPGIQKDWFANRDAFDPAERGYFYRVDVNGYVPTEPAWLAGLKAHMTTWAEEHELNLPPTVMAAEPWPGIDTFSVAIDPGKFDPAGIQCWGWGRRTNKIQHVFDWTSEWNARLTWADIMEIGKFVQRHFATHLWCYDTNSENELNTFTREYGVPAIKAARKMDKAGQIRKTNDSLKDGTIQVMIGSSLETDYLSAILDKAKLSNDQWDWTNDYHPTASECGRYLLGPWWDNYQPPKKDQPKLDPFEAEQKRMIAQASLPKYKQKRKEY